MPPLPNKAVGNSRRIKTILLTIIIGGMAFILCFSIFSGIRSQNPDAQLKTAYQRMEQGRYIEAANSFAKVIELRPESGEAYLGLAKAYEAQGDAEKAREILALLPQG